MKKLMKKPKSQWIRDNPESYRGECMAMGEFVKLLDVANGTLKENWEHTCASASHKLESAIFLILSAVQDQAKLVDERGQD